MQKSLEEVVGRIASAYGEIAASQEHARSLHAEVLATEESLRRLDAEADGNLQNWNDEILRLHADLRKAQDGHEAVRKTYLAERRALEQAKEDAVDAYNTAVREENAVFARQMALIAEGLRHE